MNNIRLFSVSDRYIAYLRSEKRLEKVFDNKADTRYHTRKYIGAVFSHGEFNYFVPFSSPKESDYIVAADGSKSIRKSITPIVRMTTMDTVSGELELKGTLKLSNMIPVPLSELTPYNISKETDTNYRQIVEKEWNFIRSNATLIMRNARVLYNQKTKSDKLFAGKQTPKYLASTIDFQYAEEKCRAFQVEIERGYFD